MLVLVLCAIAFVSPFLVWRWPSGVLLHNWRLPLLIWAALIVQTVALVAKIPSGLAATLHIATYVAAIAFLWFNRTFAGVLVVGAGAALNGVVIALNGGTLPASAAAVERAGLTRDGGFANSAVLDDPILLPLGDVFAWPSPMPLANTFSIGDVLIVVGVWIAVWLGGTARIGSAPTRDNGEGAEGS